MTNTPNTAERERERQAAFLYSIIQSAEESEGGGPSDVLEAAYDEGILYAARAVLDNWAKDTDWTEHAEEYAEEIRSRTVPGEPAWKRGEFRPAVEADGLALYRHECGTVEGFPEPPDHGGCDACESGSDQPCDWQPMYIRAVGDR